MALSRKLKRLRTPVVIALLAAIGAYLVVSRPSEEERVMESLHRLRRAVELRRPDMLAEWIHPDFQGWANDKAGIVERFRYTTRLYDNADIRILDSSVEIDGDRETATVTLEWNADLSRTGERPASLVGDNESIPMAAEFAKDRRGRWRLIGVRGWVPQWGVSP